MHPFFEYKKGLVLERNLRQPVNKYAPKVNANFKFASIEELEKLNSIEYDFNDATYHQAKEWHLEGDSCLLGYVNGNIVTYLWINFKTRELPGLKIKLGEKKAYFFKTFTIANMRGLGLNPACLTEALSYIQTKDYQKVYIDVNIQNYPSIKAIEKAGFQRIGSFRTIRILRWPKTFLPSKLRKIIEV